MCSEQEYDALLLLSFGGPEGPDDVRPFLENVTAGRGIPPERLDEVGAHYYHFGGKSPLNDLNREIISHIQRELEEQKIHLPIYFGNRNWHPFAEEVVEKMAANGVKNALVFATSAWAGYSGCRQYDEDIARIRTHLEKNNLPMINFRKIRQFYDHPLYITAVANAVTTAYSELGKTLADNSTRLVFTAHSIPTAADNAAGTLQDGPLYSTQVKEAAKLVAQELGVQDYDVVWQSRSGAPHIPWLEPDVVDHLGILHDKNYEAIVVCPIGFISDHIEVAWDLDSELKAEAEKLNIPIARAATAGPSHEFQKMVVELIREITEGITPRRLSTLPLRGSSINGEPCSTGCCQMPKRPHSAEQPTRS